ncbi:ABC transporter ATP binding protein [Methanocella paludicola SANAE]|uniref:ABC transporter ATP binding protein n=1 Tax=Methanocella paludicola (strain DSM 17711 / JCM 13418 / NBRC 101707 / SANAE) TaxID=304371 RepID=D1YW16_METPS|nr:ATP-binding cassette domain-containing protein [Methanocella paludicola]BAI60638.1 ABC transporter ATP binding protein [Methanocella paludicola SANAE]
MPIAVMADTGAGIKFWDAVSQKYDNAVDGTMGKNLRPTALEKLSQEAGLGRAVELGCGTGYFTKTLARVADSVVATDFCEGMLARAMERLSSAGNITFQKEDCMKTSFPDDTFDTVLMALVLNYIPDPAAALAEARRILKPGGRLIIVNPDNSFIGEARKRLSSYKLMAGYGDAQVRYPQTFRNLSADGLYKMLETAGFKIEASELIRDDPGSYECAIDAMEYVRAAKATEDFDMLMSVVKSHGRRGRPGNAIDVRYLVKNYGKFPAVCGVSFYVRTGEVFALLGPNGAGKTTIVEVLELLKTPTRGFISIFGNAVLTGIRTELGGNPFPGEKRDYGNIKERIGVLPQGFNLFGLLTVYENIDYFARMYSKHVDVDRMIDELGLREKRNALFKDLSGGLKQRVGIAIALINDPDIVFLDEPTTGLDPRSRRDVWEAIKAIKAKGKTVFLTTHYMDEAYHLADRVCIINKGIVIVEGTPEDLINRHGGGNVLVIRECNAEALDPLSKAIPGSTIEGDSVLVKLRGSDGMASIAKAVEVIKSGGFACREIYVKKPTLEDVFLNLTGENLVEGGT